MKDSTSRVIERVGVQPNDIIQVNLRVESLQGDVSKKVSYGVGNGVRISGSLRQIDPE